MSYPLVIPNGGSVMAGSLVTTTATFLSEAGTPADPTTVVLKYQLSRGGTVTTVTYPNAFITKVSTGVYKAEIDTTSQSGPPVVEWIGTGTVQAIGDASWTLTAAPL